MIRSYLNVSPFDDEARKLLCQALLDAALTKDDLADIVNVGIETLVKPEFGIRHQALANVLTRISDRVGLSSDKQ